MNGVWDYSYPLSSCRSSRTSGVAKNRLSEDEVIPHVDVRACLRPYQNDWRTRPMEVDYEKLQRGLYELERLPKDFTPDHPVPDFGYNLLNSLGLLYRPVLDEHYGRHESRHIRWPGDKPFAVCLTHDVDSVSEQYFRYLRKARGALFLRRQVMWKRFRWSAFHRMRYFTPRFYTRRDPLHLYEQWLEIEERNNARSTFFFWPGWSAVTKHHPSDCTYDLQDPVVFDGQKCSVNEMIQEIDRRGWEIGLHPSWYSFNDADEMKAQKETLEKAVGHEIVSVRQHFLHYDIRLTPGVQELAGFRYDSTLGFNDNVGFRFGTCHPWKVYDTEGQRTLSLVEIPLIVQDTAMLRQEKGLRLDADTALAYVLQLAGEVERVGGVMTLLWHPNAVSDPITWNLYSTVLERLRERNPWFASVREIGECWSRQS